MRKSPTRRVAKYWVEDIKQLTKAEMDQNINKEEQRIEELRKRYDKTWQQFNDLNEEQKGDQDQEADIRKAKRAAKYVIPWGLEEIMKSTMGYILMKTNRIID